MIGHTRNSEIPPAGFVENERFMNSDAKRILTENRGLLDEISEFLLVKETITGDELMAYVNADKNALPAAEKTEE